MSINFNLGPFQLVLFPPRPPGYPYTYPRRRLRCGSGLWLRLRCVCEFIRKPAGVPGASSSLVVERRDLLSVGCSLVVESTAARDGKGQEEQEETPQEKGLHLELGLLA